MKDFLAALNEAYVDLSEKLISWVHDMILHLPNLVIAVFVGLIAYYASKYVKKLSYKFVKRFTKNPTVYNLAANLTTAIFALLSLFLILTVLNLGGTINKILATAGVLGLAVGLALQDPMNNLFSGVFMSVRKLYKIGDLVETNGYFGKIVDIDLRSTKLRLPQGQKVVIPNKEVLQKPLKNYTQTGERRVEIPCGVSYTDDLDQVEKVAKEAIQGLDGLLKHKSIDFLYQEFGDSSVNFVIHFWIGTSDKYDFLKSKSNAIRTIKKAFDQNNISIPYPVRTLELSDVGLLSRELQNLAN